MKKVRKGFTLVELLIVIAIMAALSAMMAVSSSESIDASSASAILNNLQTMKASAFEMYMQEPKAASMGAFALNDTETPIVAKPATGDDERSDDDKKTPNALLATKYLGKATLGTKYSLIGSTKHWYVVYTMDAEDSTAVRSRLADKAADVGLYGTTTAPAQGSDNCGFSTDYAGTEAAGATAYIALQVR